MLDDRDVISKGEHLRGLVIDLVVAGGIAAVETPKFIRELRRYGAVVRVFMTANAGKFITPLSLEWASKFPVVTELTGSAEHIASSHLIVVAPATLDFIGKASWGLADSPALTLVQSALGRLPVFFAPSMHESLSENPLYQENRNRLAKIKNVFFLEPLKSEGKLKSQAFESMAARICHHAGLASRLRGVSIALSLGPTRSIIDDVRYISNRSTGALGLCIADELFRRGARVESVAGPLQVSWPEYLIKHDVETNAEMRKKFRGLVKAIRPKAMIFSAAVLDFDVANAKQGKSSSTKDIDVKLKPSPKLIQEFSRSSGLKVGFKLESRISDKELIRRALESLRTNKASFVVANRLEDVSTTKHRAFLIYPDGESRACEGRGEIARAICDSLADRL